MSDKIKPCPFCGAKEPLIYEIPAHTHLIATWMPDYDGGWVIECRNDNCSNHAARTTKGKTIEAWNRKNNRGEIE